MPSQWLGMGLMAEYLTFRLDATKVPCIVPGESGFDYRDTFSSAAAPVPGGPFTESFGPGRSMGCILDMWYRRFMPHTPVNFRTTLHTGEVGWSLLADGNLESAVHSAGLRLLTAGPGCDKWYLGDCKQTKFGRWAPILQFETGGSYPTGLFAGDFVPLNWERNIMFAPRVGFNGVVFLLKPETSVEVTLTGRNLTLASYTVFPMPADPCPA